MKAIISLTTALLFLSFGTKATARDKGRNTTKEKIDEGVDNSSIIIEAPKERKKKKTRASD